MVQHAKVTVLNAAAIIQGGVIMAEVITMGGEVQIQLMDEPVTIPKTEK